MAEIGGGGTDASTLARISSLEAQQVPSANATYQMPTTAANTNAVLIASGKGTLTGWQGSNVSGSEYYVKFYDKATAPVVGTDVPVLTIRLPTQEKFPDLPPLTYVNGLGMAITLTGALADTNGVTNAGDIVGLNIFYRSG